MDHFHLLLIFAIPVTCIHCTIMCLPNRLHSVCFSPKFSTHDSCPFHCRIYAVPYTSLIFEEYRRLLLWEQRGEYLDLKICVNFLPKFCKLPQGVGWIEYEQFCLRINGNVQTKCYRRQVHFMHNWGYNNNIKK